ncbi:hypothetical protein [Microbacterium sp. NPDC089696]
MYPVLTAITVIAFAASITAHLIRRRLNVVAVQLAHLGAKVSV